MIERWQSKDPNLIIDKKAFFGVFYEDSPSLFKLSIGDRLQMKELVDYVKKIVNSTDPSLGIQYFAPVVIEKNIKRDSQLTERYFGFSRQATSNGTSAALCDSKPALKLEPLPHDFMQEMSQKLFDNLMNVMLKKGVKPSKAQKLRSDLISVQIANNGRITGKFPCVLCGGSCKKLCTAQCTNKNGKAYWTLSNFALHIQRHGIKNKKNVSHNEIIDFDDLVEDECSSSFGDDIKHTLTDAQIEEFNQIETISESEDVVSDILYSSIELNIEPLPEHELIADFVSEIYKQISAQMSRMNDATLTNDEYEFDMNFIVANTERTLKTAEIPALGSCLYGALSHQLYGEKITSDEYNAFVKQIRVDVVSHISQNYASYLQALKGTVFERADGKPVRDIVKACKNFLHNELPNESTWGGGESIKAVHEMNGVNILIIYENGLCNFLPNGFDRKLTQTVVLAYRIDERSQKAANGNVQRNHYDSVVRMEQSDIFDMANTLAAIEYKKDAVGAERIELLE